MDKHNPAHLAILRAVAPYCDGQEEASELVDDILQELEEEDYTLVYAYR